MLVLAFDRDWTVDVNPHPRKEAVPLEWVRHWAHETEHEVWAIGNQDLVEEAAIPGTVECIRRRDGDCSALGEQDEDGYYEWWPDREERLEILAELFPEADGYTVVDDLDLGHVDEWDHYHAWEFVPAVRQGSIDLELPAEAIDPSSEDTLDSEITVREVLQEGYLFELTHCDDGEQRTHLVRHVEPHRPSMKPLRGPPAFWFEPLGADQPISVRLPDLVDLQPVPYDRLPDPLTGQALATLADGTEDDPEGPPLSVIRMALDDAVRSEDRSRAYDGLLLGLHALRGRDDAFDAIAEPTFALLRQETAAVGAAVIRTIANHAETAPTDLEPHVPDLVPLITPDSSYRSPAARCLMAVAEANPAAAVDAVPALATIADTSEDAARSCAVYALSQIAAEYPEQVYPAVGALVDAIRASDETIQSNATTALGQIASEYPNAAEPITADIAELLDADAKRVRNNAAGLLCDIAQQYPGVVIEYADELAALLDDSNIQARINASIALIQAGEADPDAVRVQHERLESALDDATPEVRANACVLIANAEAPVPMQRLRDLRSDDPNETVRERAAWAIERLL